MKLTKRVVVLIMLVLMPALAKCDTVNWRVLAPERIAEALAPNSAAEARAKRDALSWRNFIKDSEGNIVKFTVLNSISPSYFYNAFSGRSEIGATTSVFWVGSFVSADVGFSVPNAEDTNVGTVVLGGNFHIDKLIAASFPDGVVTLKVAIPESMEKFFNALNVGLYIGHDTTNRELAGGIYSALELKF